MNRPGTGARPRPFSRSGLVSQAGNPMMHGAGPSRMGQSRMGTAMRTAGVGMFVRLLPETLTCNILISSVVITFCEFKRSGIKHQCRCNK